MSYSDMIEQTPLVREVETCTTTGDLEYSGTAIEVSDVSGHELFHIVVDRSGERQVLFLAHAQNYRIALELLENLLLKAKQVVCTCDEQPP